MILWRSKRGPTLTPGRAAHLLAGLLVPIAARSVGGYEAMGWACAVMLVGACVWEILTVRLARWLHWAHGYGDVVDLGFFSLGVTIAALIGGA